MLESGDNLFHLSQQFTRSLHDFEDLLELEDYRRPAQHFTAAVLLEAINQQLIRRTIAGFADLTKEHCRTAGTVTTIILQFAKVDLRIGW